MSSNPAAFHELEQSPFHAGELAIQERVGVREKINAFGRRANRDYLTQQHREFFALLPYLFVGSVDRDGQPWASMLMGPSGFVSVPDEHRLRVSARPIFGDPLNDSLRQGTELAVLGVQLHTRRRKRATGFAEEVGDLGFTLRVRQTLGICPQYIQGREPEFHADPLMPTPRPVQRLRTLDAAARAIISAADTYFVASVNPRKEDGATHGADVSHRGGRPGFVRVEDAMTLTAPDFVGNFIFNTLGNWQIDDRAGLLFVDFAGGDVLYVAARAEIIWDSPEVRAFVGAQRLVRYHIDEVIRVEVSLPARLVGRAQEAARHVHPHRRQVSAWRLPHPLPEASPEVVHADAGLTGELVEGQGPLEVGAHVLQHARQAPVSDELRLARLVGVAPPRVTREQVGGQPPPCLLGVKVRRSGSKRMQESHGAGRDSRVAKYERRERPLRRWRPNPAVLFRDVGDQGLGQVEVDRAEWMFCAGGAPAHAGRLVGRGEAHRTRLVDGCPPQAVPGHRDAVLALGCDHEGQVGGGVGLEDVAVTASFVVVEQQRRPAAIRARPQEVVGFHSSTAGAGLGEARARHRAINKLMLHLRKY